MAWGVAAYRVMGDIIWPVNEKNLRPQYTVLVNAITRTRFNHNFSRRHGLHRIRILLWASNSCDGQGLGVAFWIVPCQRLFEKLRETAGPARLSGGTFGAGNRPKKSLRRHAEELGTAPRVRWDRGRLSTAFRSV